MNATIELLQEAAYEIRALRRSNELLRAKVEVMDLFACVLHTKAAERNECMSPDVVQAMEREIVRLSNIDKTVKEAAEAAKNR